MICQTPPGRHSNPPKDAPYLALVCCERIRWGFQKNLCKDVYKNTTTNIMLLDYASNLIKSVKNNNEVEIVRITNMMNRFSLNDARSELVSDEQKLVFWVNIYNAYFQRSAQKNPLEILEDRGSFFVKKQINLFGLSLCLDQIEHGFLRRSKWKFGFGFIRKPFISKNNRMLSLKNADPRIHFLLNCGGKGCPVIRSLTVQNLDATLKVATLDYLNQEVALDIAACKIKLNRLFLFYLGDFGGKKGLKKLLIDYKIITASQAGFRFKFTTFDKSLKLDHFTA